MFCTSLQQRGARTGAARNVGGGVGAPPVGHQRVVGGVGSGVVRERFQQQARLVRARGGGL